MSPNSPITTRQRISRTFYFFPFQLVFLQLKKNYFLMLFWVLLFGFILDFFGAKYGISHLFLFPEYNGVNGFLAFSFVGFSVGGFIVSYNLYTYIIHGHRFPFIATLDKPFLKFSINNFIVPLLFVLTYFKVSFYFQTQHELLESSDAFINLIGFTAGMFLMLLFSFVYFHFTNKNVRHFSSDKKKSSQIRMEDMDESFASSVLQKPSSWETMEKRTDDWPVETYLMGIFKIKLARSSAHYPRQVLEKVFSQHHVNASFFELLVVISFVIIGLFRERAIFEIPAAASAILYFTISIMVFSAIYSWIKGWTFVLLFGVILIFNYSPMLTEFINIETRAYGLDYSEEKRDYNPQKLSERITKNVYMESRREALESLESWKKRHALPSNPKPKLVMVAVSGGGLRSARWTMRSLTHADSCLQGNLLNQVQMITGSSGGMIGASYLRELLLRSEEKTVNAIEYQDNISKDLLNPIVLAMATHDLGLRYRKVEMSGSEYLMDRAYSFEEKLNSNTNNLFKESLSDYSGLEKSGNTPTLIFAPTINNDGRRLIISSSNVDYLCYNADENAVPENLSYSNMFGVENALNTKFTSVLRMNATFPYILPATTIPFSSTIKVSDAGLRDNFGLKISLSYISEFSDWIEENTSGVILLEVRDTEKNTEKEPEKRKLLNEVTAPLGSVYSNVIKTQDYENELQYKLLVKNSPFPIDKIPFELIPPDEREIALSWHLTGLEKSIINDGVKSSGYLHSLATLKQVLGH